MDVTQMSCRAGLTPADAEFLSGVLDKTPSDGSGEEDAFARLLGDENTRDLVLDHPLVRRALLERPEALRVSPRLYFYVLVRHALRERGLDDCDVADYVASVLVTHAPAAAQPATGRRGAFFYATDQLEQMSRAGSAERFGLGVRLADLALLATGVFADHVRYREKYRAAPGLEFYESVGRAQYRLAGGHRLAQEFQLEHVYQTLGEAFAEARRALNYFSDQLVFLGGGPGLPFESGGVN